MGVEAAGVGENPGVAATEKLLLKADAGVLVAGDDAVRTDAEEGDDGGSPAFDLRLEAPAAGSKLVVGQSIGADVGEIDEVHDSEFEIEKQ